MKNFFINYWKLSVLCCIMMATSVCNAQNLTGSGTESEPYLISTQSDLEIFANNVNSGISYDGKFIKLTDNIECDYNENNQWTPIGDDNNSFQGTFDGNGKTISRLYFDNSNQIYVGLFGYNEGTIKNVGVVKSNFKGKQAVGGVCGYNYYGTITNCYNTGEVSGSDNISGVCGFTFYGTITNCYNTGEVSGSQFIGGVCGYNHGDITNCYNTGVVSGSQYISGVCGENFYGTITNCYNTGEVSGSQYISGVCGYNLFGTITNCYYLSDADNGNEDKTQEQFANGEVAYKLGGAFFQTIGEDASPVLNSTHGVVYQTTGCSRIPYSNTENDFIEHINFDGNGFCSVCGGGYEPAKYSDENGVYQIANAGNLYWFAQYVNKGGNNSSANAVLISDIVVNENLLSSLEKDEDGNVTNVDDFKEWILIGNLDVYYKGTFDGNGHTISGLYFNKSNQYNVGLFGQITGNAVIKNVGVIDSYFKGDAGVGGVCGDNDSSKGLIENCYNASIVIGKNYVGGVCGDNSGTITNCYNAGGIEGHYSYSYTGGVCGFSENTIINCYNIGDIEGYYNTGGVCGSNKKLIKNCYNIGEVNGDEKTGGVCGDNYYGTIQYCHNVGMVNSEHYYIGGVCGYNSYGTIQHCYFNSDIYQGDASCGDAIDETVAGKSSADFKNLVIGLLNVNGNNVWGQGLSYPMLISNHVHEYSNGFCMVCNVCQQPEQDEKGVYQIANAGNLYWFANYVNQGGDNANAFLANDIVVNENLLSLLGKDENGNVTNGANFKAWNPMGYYIDGSNYVSYAGTFDGNGHTISGLYFNDSSRKLVGLFGRTTEGASIKNVGVVDSYFKGGDYVGGVCGMNGDTITNCYNTGEVSGGYSVGGVCGGVGIYCTITNCYNMGAVTCGGSFVGGISGNNYGSITNCYYLETSANTGIGKGDGEATAKTATQFASGEVAYKLGDEFYQKIGEDALPVLDSTHGKVYLASPCIAYSNTENATIEHKFDINGYCTVCGAYEPASEDENGVYQIANAGNLYWFANFVNQGNFTANAILTDDIVVNTLDFSDGEIVTDGKDYGVWGPIGYDDLNNIINYQGTFNGNGHTISGLYFDNSDKDLVGLFGFNSGTIKNVGVVDSYFKGQRTVGGVCGLNNGTITNCYNTGEVSGSKYIGGVCGENFEGTITNCYNTGVVSGDNSVGGVCGIKSSGTIANCYNTGEVSGSKSIGGVSGDNLNGTITNCYNTGVVSGNGDFIGGVCGYNDEGGTITNCYFLSGTDAYATQKTAEQFADGEVAKLLFASDTIWGQNTSTDTVPNFSGKILFKVTLTAENGIAENGLGEYNKKYEIKATPNIGYHFVEWSNGSTEIKDSILVVNDTALVATFKAHSFGNWDTTLVATCAVAGLRTRACACGEVETDTIAKLAHTVVVDSAKTATCTVAGLTEGKHCSVCGSVLVAQQTIPFGHKVVVDSAVAATCTVAGLTEGKHCSVCDSVLVAQQIVAKLAHTVVVDSAKTATCTVAGLTEGKHCSVCDSVLVAQQTLPALGHKLVIVAGVSPTCTAEGLTEGSRCSVCGEVIVAQQTIPALGHSFTNYIYNNDATTEADGTETAVCDHGCGATDTRTAEGTKLTDIDATETAEVAIYAHHNVIVVENAEADIYVYDVTGRCIEMRESCPSVEIAMQRDGIYIVRTGDKVQRVAVK